MRVCLVSLLLPIPTSAVAQTADVRRTAWGVPDLSGYWEYRMYRTQFFGHRLTLRRPA